MLHQHNVVNRSFHHKVSTESPLGYLVLTYPELKCLEIALHFLTEQFNKVVPHPLFINLRQHYVHYLQERLNRLLFRYGLSIVNQQEQRWQIASLEDIEWLDLALRFGVTWETVRSMAKDFANYESDMHSMHDNSLDNLSYIRTVYENSFSRQLEYYSQFMSYSVPLQTKLRVALEG